MSNPLLDFSGLPRFAEIKNEHIKPAIEALLKENRTVIEKVRGDDGMPSWETFVQPMVDASERLSRAWGQISHLNAIMNSPELREIYNDNLPVITQFYAELTQDLVLLAHGRLGHAQHAADLRVGEACLQVQAKNLSNLAYGDPGGGHRSGPRRKRPAYAHGQITRTRLPSSTISVKCRPRSSETASTFA